MACTYPTAGVAVEVLVEENQILPVRIGSEPGIGPMAGSATGRVGKENPREPRTQLAGNFLEVEHPSGADWALDPEVGTVEVMEPLQRLQQQVVEGKPDRAPPVGVAAE